MGLSLKPMHLKRACLRFQLRPGEGRYLLAMLSRALVSQEWLAANLHKEGTDGRILVGVTLNGLRRQLKKIGVAIQNIHGEGWFLKPEDKTKIRKI